MEKGDLLTVSLGLGLKGPQCQVNNEGTRHREALEEGFLDEVSALQPGGKRPGAWPRPRPASAGQDGLGGAGSGGSQWQGRALDLAPPLSDVCGKTALSKPQCPRL